MRRLLLPVAAVGMSAGFVLFGATAAFAHINGIEGAASCSSGQVIVTWTIENQWPLNEVATVDDSADGAYNPFNYANPAPTGSTFTPVVNVNPPDRDPLIESEETTNHDVVPSNTAGVDINPEGSTNTVGSPDNYGSITQVIPASALTGTNITATVYVHGYWSDKYQNGQNPPPPGDYFTSDVEGMLTFQNPCPSLVTTTTSTTTTSTTTTTTTTLPPTTTTTAATPSIAPTTTTTPATTGSTAATTTTIATGATNNVTPAKPTTTTTSGPATASSSASNTTTTAPAIATKGTAVSGATSATTGEPWAGSTPYVVIAGGLGVVLVAAAELLRRRTVR